MGKGVISTSPKRVGKMRISRTSRGYFHDLDPYSLHGTKKLATTDRQRMLKLGAGVKSRKPRVSTFYTILQDKRKNHPVKFGNVPQGPHTFPHHGLHHGLIEARKQNSLDTFASLIPSPQSYNARVDNEIPVGHGKRPRAEIAQGIFKKRHKRFLTLKAIAARGELDTVRYAHAINKLLQMDPFGSYAYKGKGAGRKALGGKGESATQPLAKQIDLPKNHGFQDLSGVQARNASVLKTLGGLGMK